MRCRPLRWLWGLPVLALAAGLALYFQKPAVEDDLRNRAADALATAGLDWARVDLDARDLKLSGTAHNEREQQAALDAVRSLWGVRLADDGTTLIEAVRPYTWSLAKDGQKVDISGFAAEPADRTDLGRAVAANLRGVKLSQNLKLARGMPKRDQWIGAAEFAAKLASGLNKGNARLDDLALSISGEARTPESYTEIIEALTKDRPVWLEVVQADVTPPMIDPYSWSATWGSRTLTLEGFVPDDPARQAVLQAANSAFPGAKVVDKMRLGGGQPDLYGPLEDVALRSLALLESGKATLVGSRASLTGVTEQQDNAERVAAAFHRSVPGPLTATEKITWRKARVPVADLYQWSAEYTGRDLVLEGFVPDEATKAELRSYATSVLRTARVTDRTTVAKGDPAGFTAAVKIGLSQLARLKRGKASLKGQVMSLSGQATDKEMAGAVEGDFSAGLGDGFDQSTNITFDAPVAEAAPPPPPPPPKVVEKPKVVEAPKPVEKPKVVEATKAGPHQWDATVDSGNITLTGLVPSEEARSMMRLLIGARLPGINVIDNTKVAETPGAEGDWLQGIDAGLKAVSELGAGRANLTDRSLTVTGVTRDKAIPDYIAETIRRSVPSGYASQSRVDYQPPPIPPAYMTTLKYDGLKVIVEGAVPSQESRFKLLTQLKPLFPDREFDDRTEVRPGAPDGWQAAITQGLQPLSKLDNGQLILRDRSLVLSGTTEDQKILADARARVAVLPKGFAGNEQLVYQEPPQPDPDLIKQKQDESRYNIRQLMKKTTELTAPECQAVLNSVIRGKAFFPSGSAILDRNGAVALRSVVTYAKRCPASKVEIAGHTDSDGASAHNQRLSERRALAVVAHLRQQGVGEERLTAVGYGEAKPIAPNDLPVNKAKNRRIDFAVTP